VREAVNITTHTIHGDYSKGNIVPAKRFNSPKEKFTGCAGRTVLETVNVTTYELLYIYALWHPYT
jgi:hypothetical protein